MATEGPARPILISIVQFHDQLAAGTLDLPAVIRAAKRLGADGIELRPAYWTDRGRELPAARELLVELNLLVTYAGFATLFNTEASGEQELLRDMEDARSLGASQLRVFQGPAPTDADSSAWLAAHRAIRSAESFGIVLALENYAGSPGRYIREIRAVLERIDSPTLATNIDIGNYARNGEDVSAAIAEVGNRAVSTHLKDQSLSTDDLATTYLGGGELPLHDILSQLDRLPQPLLYCFEFQGGKDPESRIERSIAFLRREPSS